MEEQEEEQVEEQMEEQVEGQVEEQEEDLEEHLLLELSSLFLSSRFWMSLRRRAVK